MACDCHKNEDHSNWWHITIYNAMIAITLYIDQLKVMVELDPLGTVETRTRGVSIRKYTRTHYS